MPSESSKLSAFQLASILASYASAMGYGTPYQYLAEQLMDSAKGSIMAQAQLVAQKRAEPKGFRKVLQSISPMFLLVSSLYDIYKGGIQ
jgi:hypothetical protein